MSISGLFNSGLSALTASQTALSVTSNNIANVNTQGYTRQDVVLDISNPVPTSAGFIGTGVTVSGITRSYDQFIQTQLLGQQQNQGRSTAMDQTWGQIEQVMNEAQGTGLSTSLTDYFNAWQDVASNPTSQSARIVLLQKANMLVTTAQSMENSITATVDNTNTSITDAARQVNGLATDIAKLNEQIIQQEAGSTHSANDLRDQRQQKLNDLAKLVDFAVYEDNRGSVTVTVGMRNLVSGIRSNTLTSVTNTDGNQDLVLDGINITGSIQKGQIGGLIDSLNNVQSSTLTDLRKLVASITQQINDLHTQGFDLNGNAGGDFFNPLQLATTTNSAGASIAATITNPALLTLDEYKITFDPTGTNYTVLNKQTGLPLVPPVTGAYVSGATISLPGMDVVITDNGAFTVSSGDSFTVSPLTNAISNFGVAVTDPLTIAAAQTTGGPGIPIPGDNGMAFQIAALSDTAQTNLSNTTFSTYYNGIVSSVGSMKQNANDSLTFDNNLLSSLSSKRDSASGVSLDEEAANLIRFQRAYEAAARMISVADQLMQTLLNIQ
jgi:flagellar hook-associated protein 1 FlgK